MGRFRQVLILIFLGGTFSVFAQDPGDQRFNTRTERSFGDATIPLREFLRDRHVGGLKVQHFCIAGYQAGGASRAWIYWNEGQQIVLWEGSTDPVSARAAIARSRRVLNMKTDVVATEADVNGSTFLVTRRWVEKIRADCQARGQNYTMGRSK